MSEVDVDGAIEALESVLPDEGFDAPVEAVEAPIDSDASVEDNLPDAESFTGFDPNLLPEDMQQVYKSMQADYTRKTQEIAELRRNYESFSEKGVDPNEALEAVSLMQRLNNDPDFALEVSQNIQSRLEELGYKATTEESAPVIDNDSYEGLPPELRQELQEMRAFRQEMAAQQEQQAMMAELEAMENTIKTTNPNYGDADMETIYSLAYATQGDLLAAQELYHGIQQRLLGSYLEAKQVPHGATPAPSAPSSTPHRDFSNLDDAHKAALEAVRNIS